MIEYFKYRMELRKLSKELDKLSTKYDLIEESYKGEDAQGHLSTLAQQQHEFDRSVELYKTNYLKSKADSLLVPMPDTQDKTMYETFDFDDLEGSKHILTTKGIYHLKSLIREEQKSKREVFGLLFLQV